MSIYGASTRQIVVCQMEDSEHTTSLVSFGNDDFQAIMFNNIPEEDKSAANTAFADDAMTLRIETFHICITVKQPEITKQSSHIAFSIPNYINIPEEDKSAANTAFADDAMTLRIETKTGLRFNLRIYPSYGWIYGPGTQSYYRIDDAIGCPPPHGT